MIINSLAKSLKSFKRLIGLNMVENRNFKYSYAKCKTNIFNLHYFHTYIK